MNGINVHNNWDKLEEVWLGDVWPSSFFDHLKGEVRDNFYKLTEWSKEDLSVIEKKFKEFGVIVRRPKIENNIDKYIVQQRLIKPPITPRDFNSVVGNELFTYGFDPNSSYDLPDNCNNENVKNSSTRLPPITFSKEPSKYAAVSQNKDMPRLIGSNIVKLGKDIIIDHPNLSNQNELLLMLKAFDKFKNRTLKYFRDKDYRLHFGFTGGHLDGQFMPVCPGLVLATNYWDHYDTVLPGWEKIILSNPTYIAEKLRNTSLGQKAQTGINLNYSLELPIKDNPKWYLPGGPPGFNEYVEKWCSHWLGNFSETYFEVNIMMLDEKNLMCIDTSGLHEPVFEELNKKGINIHVVPWRTRTFWDGGLHCITLDVRRQGTCQDYFPDRNYNGLGFIISNYDSDKFLEEYNRWIKLGKPDEYIPHMV